MNDETNLSNSDSTEPIQANRLSGRRVLTVIGVPALLGIGIILAVSMRGGEEKPQPPPLTQQEVGLVNSDRETVDTVKPAVSAPKPPKRAKNQPPSHGRRTADTANSAVAVPTPPKRTTNQSSESPRRVPGKPAQAMVGLKDDDITLLKLASVMYYHNRDFVAMDPETTATVMAKTRALVMHEAFPSRATGRSKLAYFVYAKWDLSAREQSNRKEWQQLLRGVTPAWRATVFDSLVLSLKVGLSERDFPTLAEIRAGPGQHFDSLGDKVRKNMTKKALCRIFFWTLENKFAETVEEYYRPNLGREDLTSRKAMRIEPEYGDEVGILNRKSGQAVYLEQSTFIIKITYLGEEPITNCLLIGEMQTTGAVDTLTEGQLKVLGFNGATGYRDVIPSIAEVYKAENYLNSMPKRCLCYVSRLKKGDVIRLPLAPFTKTVVTGTTIAAYCDQGYVPKCKVPFSSKDYQAWRPADRRNRGGEVARLRSPF